MSEDMTNTGLGEEKESSGLLLSVESMQGSGNLSAQAGADKTDTDSDTQDSGDALVDVDGTDESDQDGTDAGGDTDETDTLGDADGTDARGDSDGNDS
jgi:hypothetical protein